MQNEIRSHRRAFSALRKRLFHHAEEPLWECHKARLSVRKRLFRNTMHLMMKQVCANNNPFFRTRDAIFCIQHALPTSINPSRDAKSCVSQAAVPQSDAKQYTTYKYAFIPRETQNLASHKQPCRKPTRNNIPHISMFLFLGRRKILRLYKADAINIKYYWPYWRATACHIPTFLNHSRSARFGDPQKLFLVCISFFFLHISDDNQIVMPFFPRPVYSL